MPQLAVSARFTRLGLPGSFPQLHLVDVDLADRNAARMRAVAARLPCPAVVPGQGPDSREATALAGAMASTTTTRDGGPSGCSTQSA